MFGALTMSLQHRHGRLVESDAAGSVRLRGLLGRAIGYGGDGARHNKSRGTEIDVSPLETAQFAATMPVLAARKSTVPVTASCCMAASSNDRITGGVGGSISCAWHRGRVVLTAGFTEIQPQRTAC